MTRCSTELDVLVDPKTQKIIDIYDNDHYYDLTTRGMALAEKTEWRNKSSALRAGSDSENLKKIKQGMRMMYESEQQPASTLAGENAPGTKAARSNLNKTKIKQYAVKNYKNPKSGRSGVPYVSFAKSGGDCTNFVSHALLAGGATINDPGGAGIKAKGWYFRSSKNRSTSFTGVRELHAFVTKNRSKGLGGTAVTYSSKPGSWETGDIQQFHSGSRWIHSTVITGSYFSADRTRKYSIVTYRSTEAWGKTNIKSKDIYPGKARRVLLLYNYK